MDDQETAAHTQPTGESKPKKKNRGSELYRVAREIAEKLGETEPNPIKQITVLIRHFGAERMLDLLEETLKIEEQGGMMVANGQRRRTPGGVFFFLAKDRMTPDERQRLLPAQQARIKRMKAEQREREENLKRPVFDWNARRLVVEPLLAEQGAIQTVKITLIGRPGKVERFRDMVVTTMSHELKAPTLPRGVPLPPETPTVYTVYIADKQWSKVQHVIARDPEDMLIIEGLCAYDNELSAMAVYAMSVTSRKTEAAKRQAQKQAAEEGGAPAAPKKKEKERPAPSMPTPPAAVTLPPIVETMPPDDAQKLRELYASAALFRQKIETIETKPEGQRFGLEMTRKLLQNVEADIAALERKHGG